VRLLARLAEEDGSVQKDALDALKGFRADYPDGFEVVASSKLLADAQGRAGNRAEAQKVWEDLAARQDVPKGVVHEASLEVVRYLIDGKKYDQARSRLAKVTLPARDPLLPRAQVYGAECQIEKEKYADADKVLKAVLAGGADVRLKARASNRLADSYRLQKRAEDAFWQYLWVDVLYNQDAEEHARALYHLSKLFREVRHDDARAGQCRERLLKGERFGGLEYQKRTKGEKER
jgi:hypothetical protein